MSGTRPGLKQYLYVTADAVGTPTGGGKVTHHESRALASCAYASDGFELWQFPDAPRPWGADEAACERLRSSHHDYKPVHAHFYAGTFTETIKILKERGTRVTYTAAAHDIQVSHAEHDLLGIPFDYPHLTDPVLWARYVEGYQLADLVICPSGYSAEIMRGYGIRQPCVIPHGFDPPTHIAPTPARFVVGYLGQPGPDKGLRYLLQAWSAWSESDPASKYALLVIAGRGTQHVIPWARELCRHGSFEIRGEVAEPRNLYDACWVYCQPSSSEGFGCEVLEARAHGRPVMCSDGAGAHNWANQVFAARSVPVLAASIEFWHRRWRSGRTAIEFAMPLNIERLAWDEIRARYVAEAFTP